MHVNNKILSCNNKPKKYTIESYHNYDNNNDNNNNDNNNNDNNNNDNNTTTSIFILDSEVLYNYLFDEGILYKTPHGSRIYINLLLQSSSKKRKFDVDESNNINSVNNKRCVYL